MLPVFSVGSVDPKVKEGHAQAGKKMGENNDSVFTISPIHNLAFCGHGFVRKLVLRELRSIEARFIG